MGQFSLSEKLWNESKKTLVGGVSSSLRTAMKPVPLFIEKGIGSRVWDVSGNEYIDYIMGYGPLILGHSHPEHISAIIKQMEKGQQYGMQHEGEIELSKKIVDLVPGIDKVSFSGSGTEAVMLALRLSRAHTGKQKVVRFDGHYHGWSDNIFTSFKSADMDSQDDSDAGTAGQSENALKDVIILPWNDVEAFDEVMNKHGHTIAAVITEPVMCNSGCIKPAEGYLEHLRKRTIENNIVFIFDEVITGFRVGPGGAQKQLGVQPDLITMGKALSGGLQLSAVGGKEEIMNQISNNTVSHLGTLNGNAVATAAGVATLEILNKNNSELYDSLLNTSNLLISGLKEIFTEAKIPHVINSFGSVFNVMFTEEKKVTTFDQFSARDAQLYMEFAEELLKEGLAVRPNGLWYVSISHTAKDVEETLAIIKKVVNEKL